MTLEHFNEILLLRDMNVEEDMVKEIWTKFECKDKLDFEQFCLIYKFFNVYYYLDNKLQLQN